MAQFEALWETTEACRSGTVLAVRTRQVCMLHFVLDVSLLIGPSVHLSAYLFCLLSVLFTFLFILRSCDSLCCGSGAFIAALMVQLVADVRGLAAPIGQKQHTE